MSQGTPELHLVTDRPLALGRDIFDIVGAAVSGGVDLVQLREKECSTREFLELGRAMVKLLQPNGVPLLVNDRVDIALAIGASGVHIGQSDMPYADARRLLGPTAIIGLSIESTAQALAAEALDVDYLGLSPVFITPTKHELQNQLGLDGVSAIRQVSHHRLIAIGGIKQSNARRVCAAGADGVAVVSAICSAADPAAASRELAAQLQL